MYFNYPFITLNNRQLCDYENDPKLWDSIH